jgi:hypothetical protein
VKHCIKKEREGGRERKMRKRREEGKDERNKGKNGGRKRKGSRVQNKTSSLRLNQSAIHSRPPCSFLHLYMTLDPRAGGKEVCTWELITMECAP